MTDLSPAAQAVLDAALNALEGRDSYRYRLSAAAALRAAANAVAPEAAPHRRKIRAELLAIATELEIAPWPGTPASRPTAPFRRIRW